MTGKRDFEKLEQSAGLTFCKNGLLFSQPCDIQPVSEVSFDWLHVFLVNGIFQSHWNLMKPALIAIGVSHQVMMEYLKNWMAPKDQKANVDASLATLDKTKNKEWKPAASEALSLYPLLRQLILGRLDRTDSAPHSASLRGFLELSQGAGPTFYRQQGRHCRSGRPPSADHSILGVVPCELRAWGDGPQVSLRITFAVAFGATMACSSVVLHTNVNTSH